MKRFLYFSLSILFSALIILAIPLAIAVKPYLPYTNYLLGIEKPTSYLILLGNDTEMRANGGFAGSYAKITLSSPSFNVLNFRIFDFFSEIKSEILFQDIYVPNGQLKGLYVEPPEPIQQAFGHGTWELANADWEPDFPTAAKTLRWFFEKGGEINPDILGIMNLSTIKQILAIIGTFPVPEYKADITPENLYLFLQGKAEVNFFPGSTQKKDALTAVGRAIIKKIKSLPLQKKIKIVQILYRDFQNQNIVIHSQDNDFQSFLEQKGLAGEFLSDSYDTYSLVETNLGANKANAFVTRQTTHQISIVTDRSSLRISADAEQKQSPLSESNLALDSSPVIHHQVIVSFYNSSPEQNPDPPFHYGGNYIAYMRLYIPTNAQNISLTQSPASASATPNPSIIIPPKKSDPAKLPSENYNLKSNYGLTEIGFWHTTKSGSESTISLSYNLPLPPCEPAPSCYNFSILKQNGFVTSPQELHVFGKLHSTSLKQSFHLEKPPNP